MQFHRSNVLLRREVGQVIALLPLSCQPEKSLIFSVTIVGVESIVAE